MDGAPNTPSTVTSEFDNMHISDKDDKDSQKVDDEEYLLHARRPRRFQEEKIRPGIFYPCTNVEKMRQDCKRYMADARFREECEARWRKEDEEFYLPGEKEELMKYYYGEISDDSDLDGEDMDDLDFAAEYMALVAALDDGK